MRFLGRGVLVLRRGEKHLEEKTNGSSPIMHRGKKVSTGHPEHAHPEYGSERRMTRKRKLSILPIRRRFPTNDIEFIHLCGKYVRQIAKLQNYIASY